MIGIYKIINPKGKVYVGQSVDILNRKNQYKYLSKYSLGRKIYNSIKKYGWDNHVFEVIENCNVEDLDTKEIFYGLQFESLGKNGLNLKLGNGRGLCSEETKQKMSKSAKNIMTDEHKAKLSLAKKGKKLSEERKKLLRVPKKNKTNYKNIGVWLDNRKPVVQYTKEGIFINEYDSQTTAALAVTSKKSSQNSISAAISGKQKTAFGFIWKYKNNETK